VHAAANVISAQLIIQEEDVVQRINEHLPPQIRLWGYEKLNKSFNAHQRCEGRVYQYWIPTYCFIPPHPRSFLGSQLAEIAKESGHDDEYQERQKEVADFWSKAEEEFITPIRKQYDDETGSSALSQIMESKLQTFKAQLGATANGQPPETSVENGTPEQSAPKSELETAVKALKDAFRSARRSYRIDDARLKRIRECMAKFDGTHNYWNYTVRKSNGDPSAKRFMMACTVDSAPIVVDGTEWLPLNFHGQSFMMNQIRKMVSIVALVVRCGSPLSIIRDSFSSTKLTIPRAPPTGLLLEHPVFDAYNNSLNRLPEDQRRGRIDFEKFRDEIEAFKREHIVKPLHGIEANESVYYNFFLALDSLRSAQLLYFSTLGIPATERVVDGEERLENVIAEDEEEADQGGDE
jgi:tRNA pseudouridine38-40 synthase